MVWFICGRHAATRARASAALPAHTPHYCAALAPAFATFTLPHRTCGTARMPRRALYRAVAWRTRWRVTAGFPSLLLSISLTGNAISLLYRLSSPFAARLSPTTLSADILYLHILYRHASYRTTSATITDHLCVNKRTEQRTSHITYRAPVAWTSADTALWRRDMPPARSCARARHCCRAARPSFACKTPHSARASALYWRTLALNALTSARANRALPALLGHWTGLFLLYPLLT